MTESIETVLDIAKTLAPAAPRARPAPTDRTAPHRTVPRRAALRRAPPPPFHLSDRADSNFGSSNQKREP
eukprot:5386035-Prymnesium_polylepis.1